MMDEDIKENIQLGMTESIEKLAVFIIYFANQVNLSPMDGV